uniref:Uncharacterized protein n=1 Tax=Glossina pallidipes TaxID=7398 RepID=A0A1B0AEG1_GLOPL
MAKKPSTDVPNRKLILNRIKESNIHSDLNKQITEIVRDVEEMDNIDKKIADIESRVPQLTNINKEVEMLNFRILKQQSLAIASHLPIT